MIENSKQDFNSIEKPTSDPTTSIYQSNITYSRAEKREIIKRQLETNFPTKSAFLFGAMFTGIGISGICLQIVLIVNQALNYEIGNGIWGGCFAIFNGLIKINMGKYLFSLRK